MRHDLDAYAGRGSQEAVDAVLGSYASAEGRRQLRVVATPEDGLCVIDEGAGGTVLVEAKLEGLAQARALVADYLALAEERGEPQTRHPWPPCDRERGTKS